MFDLANKAVCWPEVADLVDTIPDIELVGWIQFDAKNVRSYNSSLNINGRRLSFNNLLL